MIERVQAARDLVDIVSYAGDLSDIERIETGTYGFMSPSHRMIGKKLRPAEVDRPHAGAPRPLAQRELEVALLIALV